MDSQDEGGERCAWLSAFVMSRPFEYSIVLLICFVTVDMALADPSVPIQPSSPRELTITVIFTVEVRNVGTPLPEGARSRSVLGHSRFAGLT